MTTRQNMLVLALGGLVIAGVPTLSANAQSGDALAHAERTCLDYGMRANSPAFNTCVGRVAVAYDRGDRAYAVSQARAMGEARETCLSYGLDSRSMGFRQCIVSEVDRRPMQIYDLGYVPPDDRRLPGPHAAVLIDEYGTRYDRYGNLLDRDGYVIRYAP
ncbi:MAG: hypothetical protein ACHQK9_13480 [Reyranellales bacterium]